MASARRARPGGLSVRRDVKSRPHASCRPTKNIRLAGVHAPKTRQNLRRVCRRSARRLSGVSGSARRRRGPYNGRKLVAAAPVLVVYLAVVGLQEPVLGIQRGPVVYGCPIDRWFAFQFSRSRRRSSSITQLTPLHHRRHSSRDTLPMATAAATGFHIQPTSTRSRCTKKSA